MEFNRITIGVGLLILVGLAAVYLWMPSISPTALVSVALPPSNPFVGKVTTTMENLFRDKPQAVIEQDGRVGIILPGGNSIQFAQDAKITDKDVVIILNAATTKLTIFNTYPTFVQNQFTYVPTEQLVGENPYVRAQYPGGIYLLPVNIEG